MDLRERKDALRAQLGDARARRSAAERAVAGLALARHGAERCAGARLVSAYAGVGDEPPTRALLDALRAADTSVLLPCLAPGRSLTWAAYDGWDALVAGAFGLLEPSGPRSGPDALGGVDLLLAPALAVDRAGHRIGRGAGYYDRALAHVPPQRVVAVVYDDEVLDDVPVGPHDRPVGAALTPSGVVPLG